MLFRLKNLIAAYIGFTIVIRLVSYVIASSYIVIADSGIQIMMVATLLWLFRIQKQDDIIVNVQADGRLVFPNNPEVNQPGPTITDFVIEIPNEMEMVSFN